MRQHVLVLIRASPVTLRHDTGWQTHPGSPKQQHRLANAPWFTRAAAPVGRCTLVYLCCNTGWHTPWLTCAATLVGIHTLVYQCCSTGWQTHLVHPCSNTGWQTHFGLPVLQHRLADTTWLTCTMTPIDIHTLVNLCCDTSWQHTLVNLRCDTSWQTHPG